MKFKVGDKIRHLIYHEDTYATVISVSNEGYEIEHISMGRNFIAKYSIHEIDDYCRLITPLEKLL